MVEARDGGGLVVVKIGGSLAETGRLKSILSLVAAARRPLVVVPGGGTFADKVRNLQQVMQFNDAAAHRLAMLGMHQMAEVFQSLEPRLEIFERPDSVDAVRAAGRIPLWVPLPMMEDDTVVPRDWSTTSDSLALRLAELMGSAPLALLKSVDAPPQSTLASLAEDGVVDKAFPALAARTSLPWRIFGPSDDAALAAFLDAGDVKDA